MLIDTVEVTFKGGDGGRGKYSFRKNMKGADGGNGGKGGDLYVVAKHDLKLLNQFSSETIFAAEDGVAGGDNQKSGRGGKDLEIWLPIGTSVIDKKTNLELYDLTKEDERILLCKGGAGGLGNWEFRGSKKVEPWHSELGKKGQVRGLVLLLKLIADFGLIGLPNAGKSSLLNELTGAHEKTADYAFTTLSPALGVVDRKVLVDIPGLIEGASLGKGLGIKFLKHIEKVKVLLHCISCESTDVISDYLTIKKELGVFNPKLLEKKEIVLLTKSDIVLREVLKSHKTKLKKLNPKILTVSIHNDKELQVLKNNLMVN